MLNVWPDLLAYEQYAIALLRIGVALFFLTHAWRTLTLWGIGPFFTEFGGWGRWVARFATTLQAAVGTLLLVGAWTQVAGLVGALIALKLTVLARRFPMIAPFSRSTYYLAALVSFSLLFLGGGLFAVDVPGI